MPKKGAKKAGGAGKQAGMTEEEKLLYVQQKAQAETELAKRREEMLTLFLRDKLQKEERNSVVNRHKLTQQWRAILRQTRDAELRSDISVLSQTFDRVLDRKDSIIQCLDRNLREAHQQSATMGRAHQYRMDRLLAVHKDRLASLQQRWDSGLEELSSEFDSERERILTEHQQEEGYLGDVTSAMELRYVELQAEAQQGYQSTWDEIKNGNIEESKALVVRQKGAVVSLRAQLKDVKDHHKEATEDTRAEYEVLCGCHQRNNQETDMQNKKLHKLQSSISTLRAKLDTTQRESDAEAEALRAAKEEVALQTRQLKAQRSQARAAARRQLTNLTVQSDAAAKKLQHIVTQGERILRRGELCRKLETEREKVLPFYVCSLTPEEQAQVQASAAEPPSQTLEVVQDYPDLERFWQRYNTVQLERLCLEKERKVLAGENRQLQGLLAQYLNGISVSDDVLRQTNSLLMVSRPGLAPAPSGTTERPRHTVVEAAHVVQRTL